MRTSRCPGPSSYHEKRPICAYSRKMIFSPVHISRDPKHQSSGDRVSHGRSASLGASDAATAPSATWMQSKPARRSRGRQPLSQPSTSRHSQPSPRHEGAWASADQASATAPMLRPASGRPGWILAAACLTAGRKRSPEGSRTKKESISSTPGLLRCLRPFGRGGLFVFEIGPSDLYIVNKAGASPKVRNLRGKIFPEKRAIRNAR